MSVERRSVVGAVGGSDPNLELVLDVDVSMGPALVFWEPLDAGAISPEISIVYAAPGGGAVGITQSITNRRGAVFAIPSPFRVIARDVAAQNAAYRVALVATQYYPPRWGITPTTITVSGAYQLVPPPFVIRGRLTLKSGQLVSPTLQQGAVEIPATEMTLQSVTPSDVLVDWEGWF